MSIETSPDLLPARHPPRSRVGGTALLDRPSIRRRPRTSRLDLLLGRILHSPSLWLLPVLLVQAAAIWRYSAVATSSTSAAVASGHLMLAHLLHGAPSPDLGRTATGAPSVYAVPAAILANIGGMPLVHLGNACLALAATWFIYQATRVLLGQGAALLAGAVLALNVDTLVNARLGGGTALATTLLAAALWLAASAAGRTRRLVLIGPVLATAVAACYVAVPAAAAVLLVLAVSTRGEDGVRSWRRPCGIGLLSTAICLGLAAALASSDDRAGLRAALSQHALTAAASRAMSHQLRVDIVPLLVVAAIGVGVAVAQRRWAAVSLLFGGSLLTVVATTLVGTASPAQSGFALAGVLAAPVAGLSGIALLRRGRLLGLRAPLAAVAFVLMVGHGLAGSNHLLHQQVRVGGSSVSPAATSTR